MTPYTALKPPIGLRFLQPPPLSPSTTSEEFWSNFRTEWKWKNNSIAGISKPTSVCIHIQKYGSDGNPSQPPEPLVPERVGIVFQFPESMLQEIIAVPEGSTSCLESDGSNISQGKAVGQIIVAALSKAIPRLETQKEMEGGSAQRGIVSTHSLMVRITFSP
ncbi:ABC transporter I family member 11, chloroplastic [Glycine max]|nr:ABC transporter I family member 11, chloroplastic [Glycine max]